MGTFSPSRVDDLGDSAAADKLKSPTRSSPNAKLNDSVKAIEAFLLNAHPIGAAGDGTTLDDAAFATAAALGRTIILSPGATYYLSQRVKMQSGSKFICFGRCTIKLKTGPGGFNNTDLGVKNTESVFWFQGVDDCALQGIDFIPDGVKEVTIYPIRTSGGFMSKGLEVSRVSVTGFAGLNGGYISINSCGAGAYRIRDYRVKNCGTALGKAYWSGTPSPFMQITGLEIDNDIIPGVYSAPGYMENLRFENILLTGQALRDFAQQTDGLNVAGSSAIERKGPMVNGIYADGVGEVCDLFCTGAQIRGVRAKNAKLAVAKFVHGAQHNYVEVDDVENVGRYIAVFQGSGSSAKEIQYNTCVIHNARGVGQLGNDDGTGGTDTTACAFYGPGPGTPKYARNNLCIIHNLEGNPAMQFVMRENTNSDLGLNNRCELHKFDGVLGNRSSGVLFKSNARLTYLGRSGLIATMSAARATSTKAVKVPFDTVAAGDDPDGILDTASNRITFKYPGQYIITAHLRSTGTSAAERVLLTIRKNGSTFKQVTEIDGSGPEELTHMISVRADVSDVEIGTPNANYEVWVQLSGADTGNILNTPTMSFLEVSPVPG